MRFLVLCVLATACVSPETRFSEEVDGVSFEMILVPGGTAELGCEGPIEQCGPGPRTVELESYYLASTETTWALYDLCIADGRCPSNAEDGGDNGWGRGDRPVVEVSWNDISFAFLPWLAEVTGRPYRLPTEAEWEFAARAGAETRYSWGDEADCGRARFGYMSDECGGEAGTVPVASYPPNSLGLYDMEGNVWEYVQDCWRESGVAGAGTLGLGGCEERVLRGGSWLNASDEVTLNYRFRHVRTYRESGDGFRVALSTSD